MPKKTGPFGTVGGPGMGGQDDKPPVGMMKKPGGFDMPPPKSEPMTKTTPPFNPAQKFPGPGFQQQPTEQNVSTFSPTTVGGGFQGGQPMGTTVTQPPNKGKFIPPPVKGTSLVTPVSKTQSGGSLGSAELEPPKKTMPGINIHIGFDFNFFLGPDIGKPPTFSNAPKSGTVTQSTTLSGTFSLAVEISTH